MKIAGVLLAAGLSTRMGQPKQLLPLGGLPLCCHAAQAMSEAGYSRLLAVIPAGELGEGIEHFLEGLGFEYVEQPQPQRGLAASFALAAQVLQTQHATSGAAFVLADMPYVSVQTHHALLSAACSGAAVVVTQYEGAAGSVQAPPTYFAGPLLPLLAHLPDSDSGPREVLRQYAAQTACIIRPATELQDIDTPQEYAALLGTQ